MEIAVRETTEDDLDFVLDAEREPEVAPMLGGRWSRERHREALRRLSEEHLIVLGDGARVGFALLQGLGDENRSIEIQRFAVTRRGEGIGRRALSLIVDRIFERHGANRVWLDAFSHNERARRAYAATGFVQEGVLREALFSNGRFESLVVMSILRAEWPR